MIGTISRRLRPAVRSCVTASLLGGLLLLLGPGCARDIRIRNIPGPQVHDAKYRWQGCEDANSQCLDAWEQMSQGQIPKAKETLRALLPHRPLQPGTQELHKTAAVYLNMSFLAFIQGQLPEALLRLRRSNFLAYNSTEQYSRYRESLRWFGDEMLKTWMWLDTRDAELFSRMPWNFGDTRSSRQREEEEKEFLAMAACKPTERWSKARGCEPGGSASTAPCSFGRFDQCLDLCAAGNGESCFRLGAPYLAEPNALRPYQIPVLRRGCEMGSADSCTLLAIFLGTTAPEKPVARDAWRQNLTEAEQARSRGCKAGNQVACDMQGEFL